MTSESSIVSLGNSKVLYPDFRFIALWPPSFVLISKVVFGAHCKGQKICRFEDLHYIPVCTSPQVAIQVLLFCTADTL